MKFRNLLPLAAAALPLLATARPADQRLQTVTNPDGSTVEVRLMGDEFFHYYTDADCSFVFEQDAAGNLRQAVRNGRVLTTNTADLKLLRDERALLTAGSGLQTRAAGPSRMAARDDEGRTIFPTISKDFRGAVVLLEFADCKFSVPNFKEVYERMLNTPGYSDYDGVGSVRDYYTDCSNGLFTPTFDVYGPVQLPHDIAYYVDADGANNSPNPGISGLFGEAAAYAVKWLDENTDADFSQYDYDDNGEIDFVFFYYAGYGQADAPAGKKNCIWPHQQDYNLIVDQWPVVGWKYVYADGKKFGPYACTNELKGNVPTSQQPYLDGIGAFCHEFAHVLGLPDYYDVSKKNTVTPGKMDILGLGSYNRESTRPPLFSSYDKWVCRWLEYTDAVPGTSYDLESLQKGNQGVRIRLPRRGSTDVFFPNEYYLVELRAKEGWDTDCPDHGVAVWHVRYDEDLWATNQVNSNQDPHYEIIRPSLTGTNYCWGTDNDTYIMPGMDQQLVCVDFRNPDFTAYLTNMRYDNETKTGRFDYDVVTEIPDATTVLHSNPEPNKVDRQVTLKWDPVEGATDYAVTVYRISNGKTSYIDNNQERMIGSTDCTYTVDYFTSVEWKSEIHAYVRPILGVPSSKTSNEILFVPNNLESGVEDLIDGSVEIYGGHGEITAPEGAEVYNLSGLRTGKSSLPAGIYVVRYQGKTVKVLVK